MLTTVEEVVWYVIAVFLDAGHLGRSDAGKLRQRRGTFFDVDGPPGRSARAVEVKIRTHGRHPAVVGRQPGVVLTPRHERARGTRRRGVLVLKATGRDAFPLDLLRPLGLLRAVLFVEFVALLRPLGLGVAEFFAELTFLPHVRDPLLLEFLTMREDNIRRKDNERGRSVESIEA